MCCGKGFCEFSYWLVMSSTNVSYTMLNLTLIYPHINILLPRTDVNKTLKLLINTPNSLTKIAIYSRYNSHYIIFSYSLTNK